MQLINNSRFSVAYTVTLSTPNAYNGSILEGDHDAADSPI